MARVASFTTTGQTLAPGGTLAALMQRRREIADRLAGTQQPVEHWMQGLGNVAQQAVAGLQSSRLRHEEQAGREQLAQAVAGVDQNTGQASPEQLATMMQLDPDVGLGFVKMAIESRRLAAQQALEAKQRAESRGWAVEDQKAQFGQANASREDTQAEARTAAETAAGVAAARQEDQQAATASEAEKARQAAADAAKVRTVSGAEAQKLGLDPARTWQVGVSGEAKDITPTAVEQWTDIPTPQGETGQWQQSQKTGERKRIGTSGAGGPQSLKILYDQQDQYLGTATAINQLNRAKALLAQGIRTGPLAGAGNYAGSWGLGDQELTNRTNEYNSIMNQEAIAAMSQSLKGATTDTEMTRFINDMNNPNIDPVVKARQVETMIAKATAFQELQAARLQAMAPDQPLPNKPAAPGATDEAAILQQARDAIAKGADAALVRKRLVDKGIDPSKLGGP